MHRVLTVIEGFTERTVVEGAFAPYCDAGFVQACGSRHRFWMIAHRGGCGRPLLLDGGKRVRAVAAALVHPPNILKSLQFWRNMC